MMLSVAICTWNRCESLRRTLASLTGLRVPAGTSWELIIVNNNGTDATDEVAASFESRLPVRLVQEKTPGLSYARNRAIDVSTGSVIAWTDDDVLVDPGWLEALVAGFTRFGADVVFGPSTPFWEHGGPPDWFSEAHYGKLALIDYGKQPFVVPDTSTPFFGLNFAIKRDLLTRLGRFREDLGVKEDTGGGEDTDLFLRIMAAGGRVAYMPEAIVQHVIPALRVTRAFHRKKVRAGVSSYYGMLQDQFSGERWLFGMPRFMYGKLIDDVRGYVQALVARDKPATFHYELQIRKFASLWRQGVAARRAGRRPGDAAFEHRP